MTDIAREIDAGGVDGTRATDAHGLMDALRRCLPLVAHPRGRSLASSIAAARRRGSSDRRCTVTNVFGAGDAFGLMCQVEVGHGADVAIFVAPIAELAFGRHPIARAVADYRRRCAQTRVVDSA